MDLKQRAIRLFSVALPAAVILWGCVIPRWAVEKWGEDQYMSYRIDTRNLALFTYPRQSYPYDRQGIQQAVSDVHEAILSEGREKSLVVFIHGRGKHPEKAYGDDDAVGEDILFRIENEYESKALMFHWPSWLTPWGYPSKNAEESGAHLGLLFDELGRYRRINAEKVREIKSTLLIHSMGARVMKRFLAGYDGGLTGDPPLFDSIVFNAPDVDLTGHRSWMNRIDFAGAVYVTVNPGKDELLKFSGYLIGTPRLGRSLTQEDGSAEPLAEGAVYLDVSAADVNHDYFIGADRPEPLVSFYRNVIMNTGVDPLKGPDVSEADQPRVYAVFP
ncbi:MAG: alpha/beta hydrolase [Desulfobacterales bacterium]|nr:alpha/beta hydrolase [Desulfobacterales bacterium]